MAKIASGLILISGLAVLTAGGLLYLQFKSSNNDMREATLQGQAEFLGRILSQRSSASFPAGLKGTFAAAGTVFAVIDQDGRVLEASEGAISLLSSVAFATPPGRHFVIKHPGGNDLVGVTEPVNVAGQPLWLLVASADSDVRLDSVIEEYIDHLAWIWVPFVAVLLAVNLLIIHRGLRPLRIASASAATIGPQTAFVRLPVEDMPREVVPLIQAANLALDRLETGFQAQRDFIMDVAHELRTPLAVLLTHLGTLEDQAAAASLTADVAAMERLVSQLLDMARLDGLRIAPQQNVDLHQLAIDVVTHLAPLAVSKRRRLEVLGSEEPVVVNGVRDSLFRAIRNLVENAIAHTPAGTTVSVTLSQPPSISVADHGPGIPVQYREAVFERFWQGNRDRGAGVGLGLAIVARTVAAHGALIEVGDGPDEGAVVTIRFPEQGATFQAGPSSGKNASRA